MGCSCIKHNLIDEETNEFNPSEDNNKEQENINNNIKINNYYIKITNDKNIKFKIKTKKLYKINKK